jgi:hypothetical protein
VILSISGPAALLDVPSLDGRELSSEGLTLPDHARPLMALHAGVRRDLGHYGAEPIGTLTAWDVVREDVGDGAHRLVLEVLGEVYDDQLVPPGTYPCGIDARFDNSDAERHPDDRWPDNGRLLVRKWSPIAVTLYLPGSVGAPAFPEAVLTVEPR